MAALAVVPVSGFARPAAPGRPLRSLAQISYADFASQINTAFRVCVAPGNFVELTLLKAPLAPTTPIVPGRRLPGDADHEKFSLILRGRTDVPLACGIHPFEHAQLGRFEMHIGPIGTAEVDGVRYQAGFNRPPTAAPNFPSST